MTDKDRLLLHKMEKWANKAQIDYQAVRSEYAPGPFSNSVILTAFSLAQIGELSGRLSEECKQSYPEVPWRQIKGMRNLLIHDYEGIDMRIVRETVEQDIPSLQAQLQAILNAENEKSERT
jgi:uncharacterized protein with HEPN domain